MPSSPPRRLPLLVLVTGLLLAVASLRCGHGDLEAPPEVDPAAITVVSGQDQSGVVGDILPDSLVVQVSDAEGNPVAGHAVAMVVVTGGPGASVAPDRVTTDVGGRAAASGVLMRAAGPWTAEARVTDRVGRTLVAKLHATAMAGPADSLVLVTGQDQGGKAGAPLISPLVVMAVDRFGNPAAGVEVHWTVTGGGSVDHRTTSTDPTGRAEVVRTLGSSVGGGRIGTGPGRCGQRLAGHIPSLRPGRGARQGSYPYPTFVQRPGRGALRSPAGRRGER